MCNLSIRAIGLEGPGAESPDSELEDNSNLEMSFPGLLGLAGGGTCNCSRALDSLARADPWPSLANDDPVTDNLAAVSGKITHYYRGPRCLPDPGS